MVKIGPHVSISQSVALAPGRAGSLGATGFAMFSKNQRQWKSPMLSDEEAAAFRAALAESGISPSAVLPHAGYLINPATPDEELREKSLALFLTEVERLEKLGLNVINIHPGAYKEGDRKDGVRRTMEMVDRVLGGHPGFRVALENTSGAGTILGSTFEELEEMLSLTSYPERLGFTLDTAHLFGAGYNVKDDMDAVLDDFISRVGSDKLYGMHLNDSKAALSSKGDRHDNIGRGLIGKDAFLAIVRRPETQDIPLILETPDESLWAEEIKELQHESER